MTRESLLRLSLLACCGYFILMATAHFFSIKVPVLFVYWDTPFYAYQDKIISFAVLAYVGLFYAASRDRAVVPIAIVVIWATVAGLTAVNVSPDLARLPGPKSMSAYWVQTVMIGGIAVWLTYLHLTARRPAHG
jgi:hypothetical protein